MLAELPNLLAVSLQVACIAAAAAVVSAVLRVTAPGIRYLFWRAVLVICLVLPWLQTPRQVTRIPSVTAASSASFTSVDVTMQAARASSIDWTLGFLLLISAGMVARLVWMAAGCVRLRRLRGAGVPATPDEYDGLQSRLRTNADVRYVDSLRQPVTFGVFRPVVLLPASLVDQPVATRHAVIAHELVHVSRRDWCWVIAEEIMRAAVWFHPAMWWLISQVQHAREEVVDATVVSLTGRRREYLEALLAFADDVPLAPAPAFARRRHLFRRIVLLSREDVMSARRIVASAVLMVAVVAAAGWSSVSAFPLRAARTLAVSGQPQSATIARLEGPAGPVEQNAKPVSGDHPIPKRIYGAPPIFPASVEPDYASVTVTLRTTVDQSGSVAEMRLGGFSFQRSGISAAVPGESFGQFASKAQFKDPVLGAITAQAMRPAFEAFIDAAADAVQRWQYEPPQDGPVVFNTIIQFSNGTSTTSAMAAPPASALSADGALRIGGAIKPPVKVKDVRPVYPPDARDAGIQGVVIAEIRIEPDGRVGAAQILRSIPQLDDAALAAILQWEFMPTHLNGQPVPVIMTVTVQFSM